MKAAKITFIVVVILSLINFVRSGHTFHIVTVLPFAGGHNPGMFDVAGIVVMGLALWGWARLKRNQHRD